MGDSGENTIRLPGEKCAEWDPDKSTVTLQTGDGKVIELNPYVFEDLSEWVRTKNRERHRLYFRRENKDHIVVDGDTLCQHNVRVPQDDDSNDLKPFPETTEREWRILLVSSSLCSGCRRSAARSGLIPSVSEGMPEFPCPECGEKTTSVSRYLGVGMVEHGDGETHEFDFDIFER